MGLNLPRSCIVSPQRTCVNIVEPRCVAVRSCASLKMLLILYHQSHLWYYFFNPFAKPVMLAVMENLQRSLAECPRDVWIVCRGQWTPTDVIEQSPWIKILWRDVSTIIYRVANGCNNSPGLTCPPAQVMTRAFGSPKMPCTVGFGRKPGKR